MDSTASINLEESVGAKTIALSRHRATLGLVERLGCDAAPVGVEHCQAVTVDLDESNTRVEEGTKRFDVVGVNNAQRIETVFHQSEQYLGIIFDSSAGFAFEHFDIDSEGRTSVISFHCRLVIEAEPTGLVDRKG